MHSHEARTVAELQSCFDRAERIEYVFFWSHKPSSAGGGVGEECLSQWYGVGFQADGVGYPTAEHYMMAEKARLFGDDATRAQILAARSPGTAKAQGRRVRGFREEAWDERRFDIVVAGNLHKFAQNETLQEYLVGTKRRVLVEASPNDRVWGVGLAAEQPQIQNPHMWQGLNLLGFALMEVRVRLAAT